MPGLNFLFWNLHRKALGERVARLAAGRSVDVLMLAECGSDPTETADRLASTGCGRYLPADGSCRELALFSRFPRQCVHLLYRDPLTDWLIYRLAPPSIPSILVVLAHLPSKAHAEGRTQAHAARELMRDIQLVERQKKNDRTVVVGDLNMNPFDEGVTAADGLHGVMDRGLIRRREERDVRGRTYPMLYNPMWGLFGDRTPGPPGTFYRAASELVNYQWNIYDQVLLRPALMDRLSVLDVIDSDGTDSLLTRNRLPDSANGSDHLPLFFRLDW